MLPQSGPYFMVTVKGTEKPSADITWEWRKGKKR